MRRFFLPSLLVNGTIEPDEELLHRMSDVLRLDEDDSVEFIDGQGLIIEAKIINSGKKKEFKEIKRTTVKRPAQKLCLAVSMIRKERFDLLVEKAVELGVDEIIPLHTERSRPFVKDSYGKLCDKWQKIADQSLSQCKRVFRCTVLPVSDLKTVCGSKNVGIKIAFHPNERPVSEMKLNKSSDCMFLIGPEGGFSDDELALIKKSNFDIYSMTDSILRTETAAFYALSVFNFLKSVN